MTEHELFHTYNKDVYRTCLYMLKNVQDAEDVCHDVFVVVFRQDWRNVSHLRTWIMRIAMNQCLNIIRRNKVKGEKQNKMQLLHKQEVLSNDPVDTTVMAKLSFAELEQQLQKLPDKLLSVVTLRYIGDLSVAEIAETLNIRQGTVRTRLYKALKLMRKKIEFYEKVNMRGDNTYEVSRIQG
ncbi:RNA polymerase sigma-70 factor, ECF subfamily [Paenibacillus sp. CF095]|uniref:RNA polymerase sigma factor n=1 Tax=Paenibacillus TaxID=44249 RepID=UPI0008816D2B|nr:MULTISPECIES: RNA polymerase sigma factor [unclassified Paenibacillus]MCF7754343.1 RNA polymerase sigma factor [Paenibacillus xylanexedens]MDQ0720368.1 RNA polymerase sigma-70 factor (ECF subfamily) [Paenibacillus sp. W4I10]SDC59136.1 RNA polymerase sigma-70 factor, ECF subfamily [Paenibacillus sp. CF095]